MIIGTFQHVEQLDTAPETTPYSFFVNDLSINRVKQVKNLDLIIDKNLTREHHIYHISLKIKLNVGILKHIRE